MQKWLWVILLFTIVLGGFWWSEKQCTPLADSVLRLHVIANSDSLADQALKIKVKNKVVETMYSKFSTAQSQQEAWQMAVQNQALIEEVASQAVTEYGYSYPVQVEIGEYEFPTKTYRNLVLPQGSYEAVRVVIGEGEGQNWWCVLFPALCIISSTDEGLSLGSRKEAQVSFKCLELLPQGARFSFHNPTEDPQNDPQP